MNLLRLVKKSIWLSLNLLQEANRQRKGRKEFKRLNSVSPLKIEFGASTRRRNWITVGLDKRADIQFDIRDEVPLSSNVVDEIYTSHLLEHLSYTEMISFLTNCNRILKKKAAMKICVPDVFVYLKLANNNKLFEELIDESQRIGSKSFGELIEKTNSFFRFHSPLSILNYIAYMNGQHKYMFDKKEIISILHYVGFSSIEERDFDPELDLEVRRWESLHIIAVK